MVDEEGAVVCEEINIFEGGDKGKLGELLRGCMLLANSVKKDCTWARKLPFSKITFREIYTCLEDGSKYWKPLWLEQ